VKWTGKIPLPTREREPAPRLCPSCNGKLYRGAHPEHAPWVLHLSCNDCGCSVTYDSKEGTTTVTKLEVIRR
jgi:hypothetical protein